MRVNRARATMRARATVRVTRARVTRARATRGQGHFEGHQSKMGHKIYTEMYENELPWHQVDTLKENVINDTNKKGKHDVKN